MRPRTDRTEDFQSAAAALRGELLAYCYRMLGSVHDAEDAVQETYLRAWNAYPRFEGRSSVRTWLYRIATNACLRAVEQAGRRPLPSALGAAGDDPAAPVEQSLTELPWLQPFPTRVAADTADPALLAERKAGLRLGLVAALQELSARQRAVLILRDVLDWRATEVADVLDTTGAAVHSLLQRARAQLRRAPLDDADVAEPTDPRRRALLDRYVKAFADADLPALAQVLTEDVLWEMPPYLAWFAGRDTVLAFLATRLPPGRSSRMVETEANGQPAVADYAAGAYRAHALHVLTVTSVGVAKVTAFMDPDLFASFGLPERLPG